MKGTCKSNRYGDRIRDDTTDKEERIFNTINGKLGQVLNIFNDKKYCGKTLEGR